MASEALGEVVTPSFFGPKIEVFTTETAIQIHNIMYCVPNSKSLYSDDRFVFFIAILKVSDLIVLNFSRR